MADNRIVWIVGRSFWQLEPEPNDWWHWTWDLHGIFYSEKDAAALCKNQHWFIAPVEFDQALPDEPCEFPGMVVPNRTKAKPLQHRRTAKET